MAGLVFLRPLLWLADSRLLTVSSYILPLISLLIRTPVILIWGHLDDLISLTNLLEYSSIPKYSVVPAEVMVPGAEEYRHSMLASRLVFFGLHTFRERCRSQAPCSPGQVVQYDLLRCYPLSTPTLGALRDDRH